MIGHYLDLLGVKKQEPLTLFAQQWQANHRRQQARQEARQREAEAELARLLAEKAGRLAEAKRQREAKEAAEDHADLSALALALVRADVAKQLKAAQDDLNAAIAEAEKTILRLRMFNQHEEEAILLLM